MAVRIRLRKTGAKNNQSFRIVVSDIRSARDGNSIETLGYYDPRRKDEKIDLERAAFWIGQGAQPSEKVLNIIERAKNGKVIAEMPKKKKATKKERDAKKAAAAAAKTEAEAKAKASGKAAEAKAEAKADAKAKAKASAK